MNLIMEKWEEFLREEAADKQETLQNIKDTPAEAADLIKKVFDADPKEQRKVWDLLMADPEITDAIKAFKAVAAENELSEGALADKMLSTYVQGDIAVREFFKSPTGQKIMRYGGPTLALALMAIKLSDPPAEPNDVQMMMKLARATAPSADAVATAATDVMI